MPRPAPCTFDNMRLGILSDTHGVLRPGIFEVFEEVDHILHAGDIGPAELLTELESIAPVTAVYGNTDDFEIRGRCPAVAKLELDGCYITVTHGDQYGQPTPDRLHREFPEADILVYGHTHEPVLELLDKTVTVMNPGASGRSRLKALPSVGLMELEAGIPPRARLVTLEEKLGRGSGGRNVRRFQ